MITGQIKSYDFRFGDEFGDFLQLVDRAAVTYKVNPLEVDGKLDETPDIRFNLQPNISKYIATLAKEFSSSCDDIEKMVDEVYIKSEKLNLLARFIIEIEASQRLLTYSASEGFKHGKFTFSNVSKEEKYQVLKMEEKDFQDYFYWMDHYLKKMHAYLLLLKNSTEIIPQSDFRLPASMITDVNASTIPKPFAFFEYLFQRNGIAHLRKAFIPSQDDYDYHPYIHYDAEAEVITTQEQDNETGEWEEYKQAFKDKLFNRVYKEFLKSRQLFDEYIDTLKTVDEIKLFISLSIGRLRYQLTTLDKNTDAKKYDFLPKPIKGLIKYIYERYEAFCPAKDEMIKELFSTENQQQIQQVTPGKALPPVQRGVETFRTLKKTVEGFTLILHQQLIANNFISSDTDMEVLRNAFNGSRQDTPLKIRWLSKGKNGKINKQTLFYLLNRLAAEGIIAEDTDNKTFLKRIHFIFVDDKGEPLQNLNVSNATSGKFIKDPTAAKQAIDAVIVELKLLS